MKIANSSFFFAGLLVFLAGLASGFQRMPAGVGGWAKGMREGKFKS